MNIRRPLIEYMQEMKSKRLAREWTHIVRLRKMIAIGILRNYKKSQLPFTSVMPEPNDFLQFPAIKAVIDQPADVDVDESSFTDIIPLLPDMVDEWRVDIDTQLVECVKKYKKGGERTRKNDHDAVAEKMKLATTVFNCHLCDMDDSSEDEDNRSFDDENEDNWSSDDEDEDNRSVLGRNFFKALFYPNVLGHRCLTKLEDPELTLESRRDPAVVLGSSHYRQKWTCEWLGLDERAGRIVASLIKAAGLDPATTTAADMDELDARFACLLCPKLADFVGQAVVWAFGWRFAVRASPVYLSSFFFTLSTFTQIIHRCANTTSWQKLTPVEDEFAREVEELLSHQLYRYEVCDQLFSVWLCMHCYDLPEESMPMNLDDLHDHLYIECVIVPTFFCSNISP
jgi:hypothetical protein